MANSAWESRKLVADIQDVVLAVEAVALERPAPVPFAESLDSWSAKLGQFRQSSPRDLVSESILALIRSGELKPGARLPSEPQLIAITGVSRSLVREAIRSLETMGL